MIITKLSVEGVLRLELYQHFQVAVLGFLLLLEVQVVVKINYFNDFLSLLFKVNFLSLPLLLSVFFFQKGHFIQQTDINYFLVPLWKHERHLGDAVQSSVYALCL